MAKPTSKKIYQSWLFWAVILLAVAAIIALVCASVYRIQTGEVTDETTSEESSTEGAPIIDENGVVVKSISVPRDEMITFCQETFSEQIANFLQDQGYNFELINIRGDVTDYNDNYGTNAIGQAITLLSWNGADNDGQAVAFSCYATKVDEQTDMLYLTANGLTVMGAPDAISTTASESTSEPASK